MYIKKSTFALYRSIFSTICTGDAVQFLTAKIVVLFGRFCSTKTVTIGAKNDSWGVIFDEICSSMDAFSYLCKQETRGRFVGDRDIST